MLDDLKNYRAPRGAFQLLEPELAGALLWLALVLLILAERLGWL
jgi:hypothetical protein